MRRSEILGLRWRNVDLENNATDVTEQLQHKRYRQKQKSLKKWHRRNQRQKATHYGACPPFFLKQLAVPQYRKNRQQKDGKPYYDNDLVVAKPDGAPIATSWVSSQSGKLLEDLDMPHIRFHDLRHTAAARHAN